MLAAVGYGQSTTTCISLDNLTMPPDIHEVCTFADGSGVEIETVSGTYYRTEYTANKWTARYVALLKADADSGSAELEAIHRRVILESAWTKKECSAVGGYWINGTCADLAAHIEDSHNAKQCQQRGGVWAQVDPHFPMCRTKDAILSKP